MKVLVVDSGGRGHAIAWQFKNDPEVKEVICAPGNVGIAREIRCENARTNEEILELTRREKVFGEAGQKVVIEKRLYGIEISFFFFTDGEAIAPMPVAQDYKRAYDNDEGLNTGGMGAYSPHRLEGEKLNSLVSEKIAMPLIRGFAEKEGIPYKGILYLGLMLVEETPYVLEVNVRLGDPEAEVILPRLKTPLSDISFQIIN